MQTFDEKVSKEVTLESTGCSRLRTAFMDCKDNKILFSTFITPKHIKKSDFLFTPYLL